ncbi:hypothetical protein FB451DRAFT_1178116 [Mycena latifolia]|nr:hypothetical protein FB451DRAFT_1178116 [Mycena latifolia]
MEPRIHICIRGIPTSPILTQCKRATARPDAFKLSIMTNPFGKLTCGSLLLTFCLYDEAKARPSIFLAIPNHSSVKGAPPVAYSCPGIDYEWDVLGTRERKEVSMEVGRRRDAKDVLFDGHPFEFLARW